VLLFGASVSTPIGASSSQSSVCFDLSFGAQSGTMHLGAPFQSPRCFQDDTLGLPKTLAGNAFCFLILTKSEDGKPRQVIAWSVVHQWYPHEHPPVVETTHSNRLNFYKSDGCTPLEDPSQEDALPIMDLIAEEPPESPPFAFKDPSCIDKDSADLLQEAIDEVYGPTRKRQHVLMDQEDSAEQPQR
jgi:hypothetical protein